MNFDFYHNYILQSYCCNLHYILAYLLFSVSNKPLPLPLPTVELNSVETKLNDSCCNSA